MKAKEIKRREGAERTEYWRGLSPTTQLSDLDRRLGKGVGARRQRTMISARMEKQEKR